MRPRNGCTGAVLLHFLDMCNLVAHLPAPLCCGWGDRSPHPMPPMDTLLSNVLDGPHHRFFYFCFRETHLTRRSHTIT
jgi:hypothetical protein